jgi:hypothetical protein
LRVRQAIRDGHLAFLAEVFGPTAIDRDDYDRLRAAGKIRDEQLLPQDAAASAHALGALAGDGQAVGAALAVPGEFWQRVVDDVQVVTEAEREAVAILRDRIGEHVRSLGGRLEEAAGRAMTDVDDASRRRRLTRDPKASSPYTQEVLARIRKAVGELRRDWLRVAHTELHNASEEAKAIAAANRDPGRDPRVFKRPRADACAFCRLLFLKPDGVTPRVFRLSALLANGSNVGRRAGRPARSGKGRTEWKAVLGAVHPFCGCELLVLAVGMGFESRGRLARVGVAKSDSIEVEVLDDADHVCEEP